MAVINTTAIKIKDSPTSFRSISKIKTGDGIQVFRGLKDTINFRIISVPLVNTILRLTDDSTIEVESLNLNYVGDSTIKEVVQWSNKGLTSIRFSSCANLIAIPNTPIPNGGSITTLESAFYYTKINVLPNGFLDTCVNLISVGIMLEGSLVSLLPNLLLKYCPKLTIASRMCANTKLTDIQSDVFEYNPLINDCSQSFYGLSLIFGAVPTLWISHPLAFGAQCFSNCVNASNYPSVPANWK